MTTILVTGIHGFLGSSLAVKLAKSYNVIGLGNHTNNNGRLTGYNFKIYSSKDDDIEDVFSSNNIDAVIHAATLYRTSDVLELIKTNLELPIRLYGLCNKYNVGLFINTDSFFNDSKSSYTYLADYTLSKKHLVEWLKCIKSKTAIVNMKVFHMYGSGDSSQKFVMQIFNDLLANKESIGLTKGEQMRDFIHVQDVVSAFEIVLNARDKNVEYSFTEYELGTGKASSIRAFVETAKRVTNAQSNLLFGHLPYRENEIMNSIAENKPLLDLGWLPEFDIEKGLTEMLKP